MFRPGPGLFFQKMSPMESFEAYRQKGASVFRVDSPNQHELNATSLKEESEALDGILNVYQLYNFSLVSNRFILEL